STPHGSAFRSRRVPTIRTARPTMRRRPRPGASCVRPSPGPPGTREPPRERPGRLPKRGRRRGSRRESHQACGVPFVDLLQDALGKTEAVDPPAALRRHRSGGVVEVLVLRLEEAVVDLVELVVEDLLRVLVALGRRDGVGPEEDPVLVLVEEFPRRPRLTPKLADPGP